VLAALRVDFAEEASLEALLKCCGEALLIAQQGVRRLAYQRVEHPAPRAPHPLLLESVHTH
jgi:hypothetical protein